MHLYTDAFLTCAIFSSPDEVATVVGESAGTQTLARPKASIKSNLQQSLPFYARDASALETRLKLMNILTVATYILIACVLKQAKYNRSAT